MANPRRYAAWTVFGIGALAVIGGDLVEPSRETYLALTIGGGVLMFLGIVAADLLSTEGCLVDEWFVEIHHRPGYFTFVVLGALLVTGGLGLTNIRLVAPAEIALFGTAVIGLAAYRGSVSWLKRTM